MSLVVGHLDELVFGTAEVTTVRPDQALSDGLLHRKASSLVSFLHFPAVHSSASLDS